MRGFSLINNSSSALDKLHYFVPISVGGRRILNVLKPQTIKSGYSPACGNEWVRGIEKPKIKCIDCQYRRFLPVTDEVIRWHLSGVNDKGNDFVMGIYPMLLDETCFFLAVDFDKSSWQKDAVAFLKTCHQMNLPAALERSRSGKGAHVWLFFTEAISASLARKLGSHILTETMEQHPDVGLDSYDRFFQTKIPYLRVWKPQRPPLKKKARNSDNSIFIDENLVAYEDQWAFLSELRKVDRTEVETIVERAEAKGRTIGVRLEVAEEDNPTPWKMSPSHRHAVPIMDNLPERIDIVLGNELYIEKTILSPSLKNRLIRLAAFQNHEFYKAQAMRLLVYDKPRIIGCAHDYPNHIGLPRGCLDDICQLFSDLKIKFAIQDELYPGKPLVTNFCGNLRPEQETAAQAMIKSDIGVLAATTAFGKTVIAAWLISQRQVNTLILVHRKQLQEQWIERLLTFLDLPRNSIGRIGGGRKKPTGLIDVALIQSLIRKDIVDDIAGQYGHSVVDECHHLPAEISRI